MNLVSRIPVAEPDSMLARMLLSFLATAGLYYVNIMPALVDGLKEGYGYTNQQAGMVGSFNMYGGACGALLIVFLVGRLEWRRAARFLLFGLIAVDLLSMLAHAPPVLMAVRFVHGVLGGALVGLSFSIFARTGAPDRTFGMLLLVQALAGGLGVMSLPLLVPLFGPAVLFVALILFSLVTLAMLQVLPAYPPLAATTKAAPSTAERPGALLSALVAVFLFQAANMGLYAFLIGLGKASGLDIGFISETLGISNWVGTAGALLVIVLSTRYGILTPIMGGIVLCLGGTWALFHAEVRWAWIASNFMTGVSWNFVIAYLLGMCARFDRGGQSAVWGGFASKMGLASGPMIGSFIVGDGHYGTLTGMALVLLAAAAVAAAVPAWLLDRSTRTLPTAAATP